MSGPFTHRQMAWLQRLTDKLWRGLLYKREQFRAVWKEALETATLRPRSIWDYLDYAGTVAVVLFLFQFASGLLLLLHYKPYPTRAFASLLAIRDNVPYGMLFANLHAAGSKLILFAIFVHLFRIMMTSAYRGPRAPQWYLGVALLALMLFTGFSGYLLPWSQQSYWACVVGTESLRVFPVAGPAVTWLLRGGPDVSGPTLTRFYLLHIIILPLSISYLLWEHLKRVWKTSVAAPADMHAVVNHSQCIGCGKCAEICPFQAVKITNVGKQSLAAISDSKCNACRACLEQCPQTCIHLVSLSGPCPFEPAVPNNLLRRSLTVGLALFVYFGMAYFLSDFTKVPADPLLTPDSIKPEWYFLAPYQVLKLLPSEVMGLLVLLAAGLVMIFLPAMDRSGPRNPKERSFHTAMVSLAIIALVVLTFWGWVS